MFPADGVGDGILENSLMGPCRHLPHMPRTGFEPFFVFFAFFVVKKQFHASPTMVALSILPGAIVEVATVEPSQVGTPYKPFISSCPSW